MHHPHPATQGLPPPQPHLQHPRPGVLQQQHQQRHPNSPQQPQRPPQQQPTTQGPYASPHQPQQHQSPYVSNVQIPPGQNPQEVPYYATHPSPYSTNSTSGSYTSSENSDLSMATATMNRQFPPIYHTPQSNSPASIQSPQHDQHGRPLYGQSTAQVPQNMYYPPYQMPQQSPYAPQQHTAPLQTNMPLMSHQQPQQMQHPPAHPHTPGLPGSPRTKLNQTPLQRPPSGLGPPQGTPTGPPGSAGSMHSAPANNSSVNPNAAPGPIPATTPLVVRQDQNGVQWIAFEYSRDRVKMEYTIRCDVESVNVDELPQEFKTENCVYPRACCHKDQYKGNRLHYETECNTVGWALAQLNPCLRGKRGLIQRAVDSWRNSNQDPRLRSRRVRRMAKINNRKAVQAQHGGHMAGPGAPAPGVPNTAGIAGAPGARPTNMGMGGPQLHHHHEHPAGGAQGGPDDVSAGNEYNETSHTHHHQAPTGQAGAANGDVRPANNFYPAYPTNQPTNASAVPPMDHHMDHVSSRPPPPHATSATTKQQEDEERNLELFGDLPEAKRRKFILVDDAQRGTRVRVRVMLDQVNMEEMPDSYRKNNSVYPRSYFPTQMQSPPASPRGTRFFDDPDDEKDEGSGGAMPITGRTLVPVPMMDGSEAKVPRPRMTRAKRNKEVTLNDLGYRMTWSQSRVFAGRTLFLQRSLDAYRNKMRSTMVAAGQEVAPHFETRVGKRRWLERSKRAKREASP
ncbi:hypothetical protein MPH_07616 [Macrophomina phaseolina MS6]|uniref:DUF8032 domain-containing protein n=1 Tax=Macrophomina phaseolina (strain MS6) TaxID=1126212 RepID=K2SE77_MACPH|nr:hypothetical protein MPH_07616 [Macrophomina phaseolina MS6]